MLWMSAQENAAEPLLTICGYATHVTNIMLSEISGQASFILCKARNTLMKNKNMDSFFISSKKLHLTNRLIKYPELTQ